MKIVSWNMNKRKSGCWEWLLETHNPDYVLAQEASPLPQGLTATIQTTTKKSNRSAFYSRNSDHLNIRVGRDHGMGMVITEANGVHFICVYANLDFKPVNPPLLGMIASSVSYLRRYRSAKEILIAGDFNMDRRMDDNPTGSVFAIKNTYPHNNFFNAIEDMGFHDCMRKFHSRPVQTHRNARSDYPWELDHMFVTEGLYSKLIKIDVVGAETLSDHDPIIAEFA